MHFPFDKRVKFSVYAMKACRGIRGIASHTITLALGGYWYSNSRPDNPMSGKESYSTGGWCASETFWTFWRREKSHSAAGSLVMTYEFSLSVDQVPLMFLFFMILEDLPLLKSHSDIQ